MEVLYHKLIALLSLITTISAVSGSNNSDCHLGFVENCDTSGECVCNVSDGYPFGGSIHCIDNMHYSTIMHERCVTPNYENISQLVGRICDHIYTNLL